MNNFFDPNSGIMGFMGKVFDVIYLSFIWTIFSIPIFTIGASTTALYYTSVKAIRRERGYIFKAYWHSFRTNFVSATVLWIPFIAILAIVYNINLKYALQVGGTIGFILLCVYCMLAFVIICTGVYVFPVLSRFTMTKGQIIKTSAIIALKHFPITVVLVVIVIGTTLGLYLMPYVTIFIPAISALLFSLLMEPILKKYTPKTDGEEAKDEWYLE